MTSIEIMKVIEEEISEHLSLNIKQSSDNNLIIQLKYKGNDIGEGHEIETKLGYYKDHGHGGHSFVDRVKLDINKLKDDGTF